MSEAAFAGLNARAFDAVTRAVDDGLPVEGDKISNVVRKALESGQLAVKHAEGKLAINAGLVRLADFTASSAAADLSVSSTLDLTDGAMDARLVLSGPQANGRPDIFMALKGPVTAPSRNIDVSALTGWLTLRSVENQAKRLKALQQAAPPPATEHPAPPQHEPSAKRESPPQAASAAVENPGANSIIAPPPKREPVRPAKKRAPSRPKLDPPPIAKREPAPVVHHRAPLHPRPQRAPSLPAPIDIHPLPVPGGIVAPEASVGPQR